MTTTTPRRPIGTEPIEQPRPWWRRRSRLRSPAKAAQPKAVARRVSLPKPGRAEPKVPKVSPSRLSTPEPSPSKRSPDKLGPSKLSLPKVTVPKLGGSRSADPAAPDAMHPRIERRRSEVADGRRRRRSRRLGGAFALAVLLAVCIGALWSPLLDVDRIVVRGTPDRAAGLVRQAADVRIGTPLVAVDPAVVRRRVQDLPWVAHVTVQRRWPGDLVLDVLPEQPVVRVAEGDGPPTWVATTTGRLLRASRLTPVMNAALDGSGGAPARVLHVPVGGRRDPDLARAVGFLAEMGPASRARLGEATLSGGSLTFTANPAPLDRATVVVGDLRDRPRKLQALEAALTDGVVDLRCVTHLDMSVPTRFTIMRDNPCGR